MESRTKQAPRIELLFEVDEAQRGRHWVFVMRVLRDSDIDERIALLFRPARYFVHEERDRFVLVKRIAQHVIEEKRHPFIRNEK